MHHRGAVVSGSRLTVGVGDVVDSDRRAWEVRSAVEWAQVRALAGAGSPSARSPSGWGSTAGRCERLAECRLSRRAIERAAAGSMLDPLEQVICQLIEELAARSRPRA